MPNRNPYSGMPLDRADAVRKDPAALESLLASAERRVLAVWRGKHLIGDAAAPVPTWHTGDEATWLLDNASARVLLGLGHGRPHFAVDLSHLEAPETAPPLAERGEFLDLRAIGPLLERGDGAIMAYARGMMHWHSRHRHCGACGSPAESVQGGHVRRCLNEACAISHFPRTDPAIIVLVARGSYALLGRQKTWPPGMHSTLAGFVEPGESLEEAVIREVFEEAGVRIKGVPAYKSSQPWPFPSSIMLGFHAETDDETLNVATDELESAAWYHRDQLRASPQDENFRMPRKDSIARRLIDDWLQD